jgi:hypothetical protein
MEVIRLKHEWCGQPIGTILKINDECASTLFQRDAAEKMEPENNMSIKDKLQHMVVDRSEKRNQGSSLTAQSARDPLPIRNP